MRREGFGSSFSFPENSSLSVTSTAPQLPDLQRDARCRSSGPEACGGAGRTATRRRRGLAILSLRAVRVSRLRPSDDASSHPRPERPTRGRALWVRDLSPFPLENDPKRIPYGQRVVRHSRESGNPGATVEALALDPRFRRGDGFCLRTMKLWRQKRLDPAMGGNPVDPVERVGRCRDLARFEPRHRSAVPIYAKPRTARGYRQAG